MVKTIPIGEGKTMVTYPLIFRKKGVILWLPLIGKNKQSKKQEQ